MTTYVSTGLAARVLGPQSFDSIFAGGCIEVRSGVQPASADLAATGDLLARITLGGGAWSPGLAANGLQFVRTGRYVLKPYADDWVLKGVGTGTAGWFRLLPNSADPGGYSLTAPRLDGAVKVDGTSADGQMVLVSAAITPATTMSISNWWFAIPPIGA